jgi:hypothetical protein
MQLLPFFGKNEAFLLRREQGQMSGITYSKFRMYKIENSDLDSITPGPFPFCEGAVSRMVGVGIDEPACQVVLEDYFPGPPYVWTVWQDQIDVVLSGKAKITYYEPPDQNIQRTVIAEAGCLYLIPRGTKIIWNILGEEPFRHLSIDFPNPGFSSELASSVKQNKP